MSFLPVAICAPAGRLGLEIAPARDGTDDCVWVASVDPQGPLAGRVRPGDLVARINSTRTKGQDVSFVYNLLLESTESPSRFMTFLRPAPPSPVPDKENTANQAPAPAPEKPTPTNASAASMPPPAKPPPEAAVSKRPLTASSIVGLPQKNPLPMITSNGAAPKRQIVTAGNAGPPLKKQASTNSVHKPKKKHKKKSFTMPDLEMVDDIPEPGFVCKKQKFYSTLNHETLSKVADKLGTDWKTMAALRENTSRYGALKGNTIFKPGTLLYIPKERSKWRMKQLSKTVEVESEECTDCGIESNPAEMLMCDGCDAPHHVACVGLMSVPEGDWFCSKCLEILHARAKHRDAETVFKTPALPALLLAPEHKLNYLQTKLRLYLENRRVEAFGNLGDYNKATQQSYQDRERELLRAISRINTEIQSAKTDYDRVFWDAMEVHGVVGWNLGGYSRADNWIKIKEDGRTIKLNAIEETLEESRYDYENRFNVIPAVMSDHWEEAITLKRRVLDTPEVKRLAEKKKTLAMELATTEKSLENSRNEAKDLPAIEIAEYRRLEVEYASLLEEPSLHHETSGAYKRREFPPRYLGRVFLANNADVMALNMLMEPEELILAVPVDRGDQDFESQVGRAYGVFARISLFDKVRDDALPMENNGVRDAQRRFFALLSSNDINKAMLVTSPLTPPTVKLRSDDNNSTACFDLSELVRDCNVDLDLAKEPTPASMATNGLELRDYQQSSLRWMLDKEKETTGLGLAGELWHRLRFQDPRADGEYFYCELTGSFTLDIFDFRADAEQKDASMNRFAMPTGGVLGEGKEGFNVECIAVKILHLLTAYYSRAIFYRDGSWKDCHCDRSHNPKPTTTQPSRFTS